MVTRGNSNTYDVIDEPTMFKDESNLISIHLPKRLLFGFRDVLALPKASRRGLMRKMRCSIFVLDPKTQNIYFYFRCIPEKLDIELRRRIRDDSLLSKERTLCKASLA